MSQINFCWIQINLEAIWATKFSLLNRITQLWLIESSYNLFQILLSVSTFHIYMARVYNHSEVQ